jgi:DNA adenine methylase Dam
MIKSPLNYTGGKFKLLPQILPMFPENVDNFYDLFCGGANVGANVVAKKVYCNDINEKVIELFQYLQKVPTHQLLDLIDATVLEHNLTDSRTYGYSHYQCDSSSGLASVNKERFIELKKEYNSLTTNSDRKNLLFYLLIIFGFNNQIRFNKKNQYNMPVGKRDFNSNMRKNFTAFIHHIQNNDIQFTSKHYDEVDIDFSGNCFVYVDPPYLITTATYNESDGWNETKEIALLNYLKTLDDKGVKFALSNVIEHKNNKHAVLDNWIKEHDFNCHLLNFSYANSSYQLKDKSSLTQEVLITNY